jgi:hypothetical protein
MFLNLRRWLNKPQRGVILKPGATPQELVIAFDAEPQRGEIKYLALSGLYIPVNG